MIYTAKIDILFIRIKTLFYVKYCARHHLLSVKKYFFKADLGRSIVSRLSFMCEILDTEYLHQATCCRLFHFVEKKLLKWVRKYHH